MVLGKELREIRVITQPLNAPFWARITVQASFVMADAVQHIHSSGTNIPLGKQPAFLAQKTEEQLLEVSTLLRRLGFTQDEIENCTRNGEGNAEGTERV